MPRFFNAACDRSKSAELAARLISALLLAFILAWSVVPATAGQDGNDTVRAFVEKVNEASVGFFASGSEADARERCRALLAWAFDVPAMGQDALGRTWNTATEAERKEFL